MANVKLNKYNTYKADFCKGKEVVLSMTIDNVNHITQIIAKAPRRLDFDQVFVKQVNRCEEDCYNVFKEMDAEGKSVTRYNLAS